MVFNFSAVRTESLARILLPGTTNTNRYGAHGHHFNRSGKVRTFFYTDRNKHCLLCGGWKRCPHRYLFRLQRLDTFKNINRLWNGHSVAEGTLNKRPQNGDIVILYASDADELQQLIGNRDFFEGMRTILVLGNTAGTGGDQYHLLAPRYITHAGRNIAELEEVVDRMHRSMHR